MKKLLLLAIGFASFYASAQTIALTTFASGFTAPVEITHPVGDSRLFVVQQNGIIKILNPDQTTNAAAFLNVSSLISTGGERGLLGLAFHPNYATNGYFFVNYTNGNGDTVIARYSVSADANVANPTGTILLTIAQPFSNHNGGTLRFGPDDGYLYIGMGDGGSGGDPGNRAQNINENLGKMLRLDVDSGTPYGIPPTNPYAGATPGNDEIWAVGMRNPWKYSFDMLNGDIWIADVGQNNLEEIDHVASPLPNNLNFGWKCYEANSIYTAGCAVTGTTYTFPVAQYDHTGRCSITGGYVYRGTTYPNLYGKYIFADYCSNQIGFLDSSNAITWSAVFTGGFTTFGQDINGEMYIAGGASGIISRITDTSLTTRSFTKNGFQIYPNPAKSEMFVKANGMTFPATVSIFDISGKLLINDSLSAGTNPIATGNLQSGIYMVKVKDNAGADYNAKLTIE